jgi:hypothetical protein
MSAFSLEQEGKVRDRSAWAEPRLMWGCKGSFDYTRACAQRASSCSAQDDRRLGSGFGYFGENFLFFFFFGLAAA